MPLSGRKWDDRAENYADGYAIRIIGTTSTAVMGNDYTQPAVLYGLTVSVNSQVGSGDVVLIDGSATADAGDTRLVILPLSSGANTFTTNVSFGRGLVFNTGIIVSATTITGAVSLLYKPRYST